MTDNVQFIRSVLSRHLLLAHLDDAELRLLLPRVRIVDCGAGTAIFHKGDSGDSMAAIIDGKVKISTTSHDGRELLLNILGPGEIMGEIAVLDGGCRTADATAIEQSRLLIVDRSTFKNFLEHHPMVCIRLLTMLSHRTRWISEQFEDSSFLSLQKRLAKRLFGLMELFGCQEPNGIRIQLRLSQQDLGNFLGVTRERINKLIVAWRKAGILATNNGYVTVLRPDLLHHLFDTQ